MINLREKYGEIFASVFIGVIIFLSIVCFIFFSYILIDSFNVENSVKDLFGDNGILACSILSIIFLFVFDFLIFGIYYCSKGQNTIILNIFLPISNFLIIIAISILFCLLFDVGVGLVLVVIPVITILILVVTIIIKCYCKDAKDNEYKPLDAFDGRGFDL